MSIPSHGRYWKLIAICRVCPGQPLAEDSLYIVAATVLATMNIDKAVGPDGLVLEPVVEYTGDLIRLALALSHPDT